MDNKAQQSSGSSAPQKPWERAGPSSGPAPFKPPSAGSTSDVVEASGTAKPGEVVSTGDRNTIVNRNTVGRPVPARPWEQQTYGSTYGGYGSGQNYNSGYGTGMYGSSGLYWFIWASGLYGSSGTYWFVWHVRIQIIQYGAPSSPPSFWISLMRVMHGVVNFFGRFSILIDQNTQAFHMFMTALLQLFDRSGLLYGELAGFVLRLLGVKRKPKNVQFPGMDGLPGPHNPHASQNYIEGPKDCAKHLLMELKNIGRKFLWKLRYNERRCCNCLNRMEPGYFEINNLLTPLGLEPLLNCALLIVVLAF
ncbi:peroxisomal membrane protein 13-like [Forsythia ovata]|uniref:Peroxin-13 n=1 Tax=Forsythia ovata TaxID=205694 RepID=A0ABD1X6H4_9LAMI